MSEENRIYLVAATIIATIGIPHKLPPMEKKDLQAASDYAEWCVNEFHKKIETMDGLDSNIYEQVSESAQNLLLVLLRFSSKPNFLPIRYFRKLWVRSFL